MGAFQDLQKIDNGNCEYCLAQLTVFGDCSARCEKWIKDNKWGDAYYKEHPWLAMIKKDKPDGQI